MQVILPAGKWSLTWERKLSWPEQDGEARVSGTAQVCLRHNAITDQVFLVWIKWHFSKFLTTSIIFHQFTTANPMAVLLLWPLKHLQHKILGTALVLHHMPPPLLTSKHISVKKKELKEAYLLLNRLLIATPSSPRLVFPEGVKTLDPSLCYNTLRNTLFGSSRNWKRHKTAQEAASHSTTYLANSDCAALFIWGLSFLNKQQAQSPFK